MATDLEKKGSGPRGEENQTVWSAPPVQTLLFDLDGTLVDIRHRKLLEVSLMALGARRFVGLTPPLFFPKHFWQAVRGGQRHWSAQTNHAAVIAAFAEAARCDVALASRRFDAFLDGDVARMGRYFAPVPGARETLLRARDLGYRIVLATNPLWPERGVRMRLSWGGLGDIPFDFVSHSEVMTRCKPSHAYYRELLEKLGLRGDQCVMIGNDPAKDLSAAELGIRTFLVRQSDDTKATRAIVLDRRLDGFGTFDDLRRWLEVRPPRAIVPKPTLPVDPPTPRKRDQEKRAMSPKLICITGPDGSGKTTQITKLAEVLQRRGTTVAAVTIWDLLLEPACKGKLLFEDPAQVDRYLSVLHPTARALFLFHALFQALEFAKQRKVDVILLNAYWYKYYATEVAHGGDRELLRKVAELFPEPALTFYLSVNPENALERKAMVSAYESGFGKGPPKDSFVSFQTIAHGVLNGLSKELGWVELDGRMPIAELTETMATRAREAA